jgi:sulfur-oxidizing protein SoxA
LLGLTREHPLPSTIRLAALYTCVLVVVALVAVTSVTAQSTNSPPTQNPTPPTAPPGTSKTEDVAPLIAAHIERGRSLWFTRLGSKNVSLETCDLGEGPGIVKGAFARLPRFFAGTDRVMDLEQRLLWCMETVQGRDMSAFVAKPFPGPGRSSDMEDLALFVASQSNGMPIEPQASYPQERRLRAAGEAMFFRRSSTMDLACSTCHAGETKRVMMFAVPKLDEPGMPARKTMGSWPVFSGRQHVVRTLQYRLKDCYREMRMPEPDYGSDGLTALSLYLASNAAGGIVNVPAVKR